ncbi:MAG: hypothetical protein R3249_04765 [Nitriliruptorales bacterium]|nr:hypothetical protein [Nitriliruptorales bacterium]
MEPTSPPGHAWDWFARQRLLWREARARIIAAADEVGAAVAERYRTMDARPDVVTMLRRDWDASPAVRTIIEDTVADIAFMGRITEPFASLGLRTAPRGLRWWWTAVSGEPIESVTAALARTLEDPEQLSLGDILGGYGD